MSECIYTASGAYTCPAGLHKPAASAPKKAEGFASMHPAWIDASSKKDAWAERSSMGFPRPATEMEDRGRESHGWVGSEGFASMPASATASPPPMAAPLGAVAPAGPSKHPVRPL